MGSPPVVEDVLAVAQEGLLGADHQEAHDVVADAGEALHLGLGDARRRDAPEALSVGLLLGYVVALHLVAASTKTSSSSSMAMKSMLSEPCAQPSSRASMPLCFRYARIASCDLSSMLFPMAVCLLVLAPAPLCAPCGADGSCGKAAVQGKKRNADALEFSEGCPLCLSEKFSRPLRASDRGRAFAPKARRGGVCREALRARALGRVVEVRSRWPAAGGFAGRRSARLGAVQCATAMPMRCPGCFVPSWRARWGVWGLGVRHGVVSGGGARRPLCHYSDRLDGRLA